jgi:hypothetical protein
MDVHVPAAVSQDEDFLVEASLRQRNEIPFGGVIYAHQLDLTVGRFIADFEILALAGEPADFRNRVEYLPH